MKRSALISGFASVTFGALGAIAAPAFAADHPAIAPTRDVVVIYTFTGQAAANSPAKMRVSYVDANQRVRLDMYAQPQATDAFSSIIFDAPGNHIYTVLTAAGSYYVLPATGRKNPGLMLNDAMEYTRLGNATIAGLACTDWTISSQGTPQGTACITPDGVTLRATRLNSPGAMEAIQVDYSTTPARLFAPDPSLVLKPNTTPETPAPAK